MKRISILLIVLTFIYINVKAQWQTEWSSPSISGAFVSGWINFEISGNTWVNKMYLIDANTFQIMESIYSTTPKYSYNFTQAEKDAGYLIYSLQTDLTGDGITEFYVLSSYGTATPYRQGFKIIDITKNDILLEKNETFVYYDIPSIWDVDNDGVLECLVVKYDYPNFANCNLIVYNTGINTSLNFDSKTQIQFELKQNYPNPFNPTTEIEFSINESKNVSINIYNVNGELVKNLLNEYLTQGNHKTLWNGTGNDGQRVSSGVYFYKLNVGNFATTKKMIILK
ncbi:MAG: T9SS type A sorting domain-containing protein [bacterium]